MNSTSKLIVGMLAAGVVGVTVGILVAPDKGSVTRKKLKGKMNDFSEGVAQKVEAGKEKISDLKDKIVSKVSGKVDEVKA